MYILQPKTGGLGWRVRPRTAVAVTAVHVLAALQILGWICWASVLAVAVAMATCVTVFACAAVLLAAPHTPTADDTLEDRTR